jgi:hypothetical protein
LSGVQRIHKIYCLISDKLIDEEKKKFHPTLLGSHWGTLEINYDVHGMHVPLAAMTLRRKREKGKNAKMLQSMIITIFF